LRNNEIQLIVAALKAGVAEDIDTSRLRYGRVIIMTDADVDGSHIRTLLLTFFYRYLRPLIEEGRVFAAQPPLYKVNRQRGGPRYFYTERELTGAGYSGTANNVQRFKGLGEMNPGELWNTTMNPETRTLVRISIEDAAAAEEAFTVLMGSKVKPRREFIEQNALRASTIHV
jgi:DNA gyrase subunit B